MDGQNLRIRPATREDCNAIADLFKELAEFEKMGECAKLTGEDVLRDGFETSPPLFRCIVAELSENVIGVALFYNIYSTWLGKSMYLEDLCISLEHRNKGIGSKVLNALIKLSYEEGCQRLDFEVLAWNPARKFYERYGAVNLTEKEEWHRHRIDRNTMAAIVAKEN